MQNKVDEFIKKYSLETSPEVRFIDLSSEIGELGKELLKGNDYGQDKCQKTSDLEGEMGDALFSLICLANTMDINLEKALDQVLAKYKKRFDANGKISSGK